MDYEPWWVDKKFVIGKLSKRTQFIRIKNILLDHIYIMEVNPSEPKNSFTMLIVSISSPPKSIRRRNGNTYIRKLVCDVCVQVPSEETINEILYRYTEHNKHAASYEWKAVLEYDVMNFITLDMNKTLTENGVKDESQNFGAAGMELDYLLPAIHLHYTDDLTVA